MAKHVILESYTFTPSTNTVVVSGKYIRREQLLLITNVTRGTVIYNFSDPSLGAATYTTSVSTVTGLETTTIVLSYSTGSHSSTDKLSIVVEETYSEMVPSEVMMDPVGKLRVSQPQSLIDTDFEYGLQPTKWESVNLLNNRPSAFYDPTLPIPLSTLSSSTTTVTATALSFTGGTIVGATTVSTITGLASVAGLYPGMAIAKMSGAGAFGAGITTILSVDSGTQITIISQATNTAGAIVFSATIPTAGQPLFIQNTLDMPNADGWWICNTSTPSTGVFTYIALTAPVMISATLLDATKTYVFAGTFFTGAAIPAGTGAFSAIAGSSCTVTTTNAHGLQVGNNVYLTGVGSVTAINNTVITVATTPTNNTFTFATSATGTPTATLNATLYPRATGYVEHSPWSGGVQFSNETATHGYQVIRQTRRYFRYQSGKGIQFSTGTILKPQLWQDSITSSGTTVTVTCKITHGLEVGAQIQVSGAEQTAYNGIFTVATVVNLMTFTYTALSTPSSATATGFPIYINPYAWYGARNRIGMFDNQNGLFFEYDGQTTFVVKRSSTYQLSGVAAITNLSATVTGTNTTFADQLKPGDNIVIRGQSYLVQTIISNTSMQIYPEYRGVTSGNVVISKTIDTKFPQSAWNIDKADGTGASGYNLDLTRMQMFYMDYSWYGAGEIRFGFRNTRGEIMYVHRIPNNNLNALAWMRSGNMCARYETNTVMLTTYLTATLASNATTGATISGADFSTWPSSGRAILVQSAATGAAIEFISYSARTNTTLTINARAQTGGGAATTFTYSVTAPIQVSLYSPQVASTINHWGSSVIMDGRYDDDKSLVFNVGVNTPFAFTGGQQNQRVPLISLRVSPAADSGQTGLLGAREIINRMQLVLRQMDVNTSVAFRIDIILNGSPSAGTFAQVGGSSLAQYAVHGITQTIAGGESMFSFFTNSTGVTQQELTLVRDIGTSILGGGPTTAGVPNTLVPTTALGKYPDGPDIITVCATCLSATGNILPRLSWTEAQA
jgi:hypothetical protein